jgi:hypothetical protein
MRVWRTIPLLLIVFAISSCNRSKDEDNFTSADSTTSPAPAANPAPATTPAPAAATAPRTASAPSSARSAATAPARTDAAATPVDRRERITVPAGSELEIILADSLNSGKNKPGDEFDANLGAPLSVNGITVFDRGTKVHGKVADVEGSGRVKGLANMRLTLMSIAANGRSIPIQTKTYYIEADTSKGRDAGVVGGGAGIGAAIGAITGGGKGAAKGAIIGGAAGTGAVLATKGKEVDFPPESKLTFVLADDLSIYR